MQITAILEDGNMADGKKSKGRLGTILSVVVVAAATLIGALEIMAAEASVGQIAGADVAAAPVALATSPRVAPRTVAAAPAVDSTVETMRDLRSQL